MKKMSKQINSMFEIAARTKLRFKSPKGDLSTEQLWDVPLRSRDDFNLDVVAKTTNKELKTVSEESFISTRKSPEQGRLELALDIIKYVIQTKLDEEAYAETRTENKKEREKLLRILAEKQDGKLTQLSEKELKNRILALEAE